MFTYFDDEKKTFHLENINLVPLVEGHKKFHILRLKDILKINLIKVLIPKIKYKIIEKSHEEKLVNEHLIKIGKIKNILNVIFI